MLEIYCAPATVNSRKVLTGLDLLGTKYTLKCIDFSAGEHKEPAYLRLKPNGTVPTGVDGDCIITESNAILQYAADQTNGGDIPAYPTDLKQRAQVNKWLFWEAASWFPSCYVLLVENFFNDEPDEAVVKNEEPKWHRLAEVLEQQLAKTRFLTGEDVTIADIAVAAPMHLRKMQKLPVEEHPSLLRWIQEMEKLPCWQKTQIAVNETFRFEPQA